MRRVLAGIANEDVSYNWPGSPTLKAYTNGHLNTLDGVLVWATAKRTWTAALGIIGGLISEYRRAT